MVAIMVIICILMVACVDGYREAHQLISPNPVDSQRMRLMNSWYGIFFQNLELIEMIMLMMLMMLVVVVVMIDIIIIHNG